MRQSICWSSRETLIPCYVETAILWSIKLACLCVFVFLAAQGNRDEGSDPGKRETQGPADIQENVLLHHAGRHAAATPHCSRSHDGEL